jgi:hypothetical protein
MFQTRTAIFRLKILFGRNKELFHKGIRGGKSQVVVNRFSIDLSRRVRSATTDVCNQQTTLQAQEKENQ